MRLALAACLAAATGACSVSYPLYTKNDELRTGSIDAKAPQAEPDAVEKAPLAPPPGATAAAQPPALNPVSFVHAKALDKAPAGEPTITPSDWAYARGALSLAMGAEAVNASVPWANPDTGAYGSFSAVAATIVDNGATCRPFAASRSGGGREQRLEGTACRTAAGHWEAVAIKATATRTL